MIWGVSQSLLDAHHAWHRDGRSLTETGKDFLVFHRTFLAKLAREYRAAGGDPLQAQAWTVLPANFRKPQYGWTTLKTEMEQRIRTNVTPFVDENDLGMGIEDLHGNIHTAAAGETHEPFVDSLDSPRSTMFFQIHGLIEHWWSRYLGTAYRHTVSQTNVTENFTELDHPLLNGRPFARLLVTYERGTSGPNIGGHVGVWFNTATKRWAIYKENRQFMPPGGAFHVLVEGGLFTETGYGGNVVNNWMSLARPGANGVPGAIVSATHVWNPMSAPSLYSDHASGVWYADTKWAIFNQDSAPFTTTSWNVLVGAPAIASVDGTAFAHRVTSANAGPGFTRIDDPLLNGNPDARLIVTSNYNPDRVLGGYNTSAFGVYYDGSNWVIYNEDGNIPPGAAFNVVVPAGRRAPGPGLVNPALRSAGVAPLRRG